VKVTNILFAFLLTLSILWYVFIFMNYESSQAVELKFGWKEEFTETNY